MISATQQPTIVTSYQLIRVSNVHVDLCHRCATAADHDCGELGPVARGPHRGQCHGAKHAAPVRCECGQWSGVQCDHVGPADTMVMIEVMPSAWRNSHADAGNGGSWPHNGATRITVTPTCAQWIIETDPQWASIAIGAL
jgi:hypothetical protein